MDYIVKKLTPVPCLFPLLGRCSSCYSTQHLYMDYSEAACNETALTKILGQFLGIVGMALAKYDLPTNPTSTGMFCLGFLDICRKEVISAKDCWEYWWSLAFKIGRLGNLSDQSLPSIDFSTLLPRNVCKLRKLLTTVTYRL